MGLRPDGLGSFTRSRRRGLTTRLCVGAIVLLALVVSLASLALAVSGFPDVPATHPHYGAITDLASRGIIGGYANGNFGPGDPVTRQQFAKMIVLTGGYPVSENDVCPFTDVAKGDASTLYPDNYVAVCAAHGIATGRTATAFEPSGTITRYQVISMAVRLADDLGPGLLTVPPAAWEASEAWATDATHGANAARAEYHGLLNGLDLATLDPRGAMNRGEVAQVLYNLSSVLSGVTPTTAIPSSTTTASSTTTTTSSVGTTPGDLVPKGQTGQVGEWKVKVTGANLNATAFALEHLSIPLRPEAGSQYVVVTVSVTNTGSTTSNFGAYYPIKAYVGNTGNRFRSDFLPPSWWDRPVVGQVDPGATASGDLIFKVPSNQVSGGCLEIRNQIKVNKFSGGRVYIVFEWVSRFFAVK